MIHIMEGYNPLEWCWRKLFHLLTAADSSPNNRPKFGNMVHYHRLPCQHINFIEIYQKVLDSCPNIWPKLGNMVYYYRLPPQHINFTGIYHKVIKFIEIYQKDCTKCCYKVQMLSKNLPMGLNGAVEKLLLQRCRAVMVQMFFTLLDFKTLYKITASKAR